MSIQDWWPRLPPETRAWLIANNGDVVPRPIVDEIEAAGGPGHSAAWWAADDESSGLSMPDEAIDWIEEVANQESPGPEEG